MCVCVCVWRETEIPADTPPIPVSSSGMVLWLQFLRQDLHHWNVLLSTFRTHSKKKKKKKKKKTRAGIVGSFSCFLHTRECDLGSQGLWLKWWLSSCLIWCLKGLAKPFVIEFDCCQQCYFPPWLKKKKKKKKRNGKQFPMISHFVLISVLVSLEDVFLFSCSGYLKGKTCKEKKKKKKKQHGSRKTKWKFGTSSHTHIAASHPYLDKSIYISK